MMNQAGVTSGGGSTGSLIPESNINPLPVPKTTRKRVFAKSMIHYVVPSGNERKLTYTASAGDLREYKWDTGLKLLPYAHPCASMTRKNYQQLMLDCIRYRPTKLGFKIDQIIPLTDELGVIQGNTVQTTTFNERPYLF